jgi:hypothetical protein
MVETYAPGRELTVSVMGDRALCVTDILTDGWYDYDAKYAPAGRAMSARRDPRRRSPRPAWIMPCARIGRWGAGASAAPISAGTRRGVAG